MFKSITDIIYKNSNFKVTILLFLNNINLNNKYKNNEIIKIYNKNPNDLPSIYMDTYNRSAIGFCTIPPNTSDYQGTSINESIYFTQRYFYEIDSALSICLEWLKSKHYKYLFNIDSDGNVKGIGSPPPFYPAVYKNQNDYIRFYPAIVRDFNNVLTEGIGIKSNKNALAKFTCTEFFNLSLSVKNYIANCYNNNIQLLNFGLNLSRSKR